MTSKEMLKKKDMFKIFSLYSFLLLCSSLCLLGQSEDILLDKIVGVVGDKIVLYSDVQMQAEQAKQQGITEDVSCQVMDQLLLEKLLINQAELDSLVVSEDEVNIELDNRLRYYINLIGSEEQFEEYYQKSILEFKEEFRVEIQKMMMAQKMQGDIISGISVTPAEVKSFFNEIPTDSLPYFNAEVEVTELVIKPQISEEVKNETRAKLLDLKQRIENEENTFEQLATTYSADPGSAQNGGKLGLQDRGTFVKEFEAAAFKLKEGEMSDIVETQFGFHLLKLLERRGNKINVQHILLKPEYTSVNLEEASSYTDSLRNLIESDSITFEDAVQEYSQDENSQQLNGMLINQATGTSYFELDQLSPDVFFAVESLKEGEISAPTLIKAPDGSKQYKLFYIRSRSEPHQANIEDDYERIKGFALQKKQAEALDKWIKNKSAQTYVRLSNEYKDCDTMGKWGK